MLLPILFTVLVAAAAFAGVIDRVAVSVGNDVITESEILRQIRLTAFQNGEAPDFSPENKREVAERLVDQMLIRMEMESAQFSAPQENEETAFKDFRARFRTEQEFRQALAKYNVSEQELRQALRWQNEFLRFVDLRFRTGIQIPEEELRDYYRENVLAEGAISFEDARPKVEAVLMSERVDNALDRWLGQTRTQLRIRFRPEVFK